MNVGGIDLTYCSNIHAGEDWRDVRATLADALPKIRAHLAFAGPLAIGLRLSAAAAVELDEPPTLAEFRGFLRAGGYYVPTINGFPYGAFHGARVKERVYQPDWRSPARVDYSNRMARVLAALCQDSGRSFASVSTVPGAFRTDIRCADDVRAVTTGLLAHARYLKHLREETGVTIALAIEPEPACLIETADDALRFFTEHLFPAVSDSRAQSGSVLALEDVRRHLAVCLDVCHMAVAFEDAEAVIARLYGAGIRIAKTQLSAALRVAPTPGRSPMRDLLGPFAEDTYLHQVVISGAQGLRRFTDLPEALAGGDAADEEWRVHFHVPIFLASMGAFETTQPYLARVIRLLAQLAATPCFEVETYTWDVLPAEYRATDVCTAIARELQWVRGMLTR